jgi:hypothetical protein
MSRYRQIVALLLLTLFHTPSVKISTAASRKFIVALHSVAHPFRVASAVWMLQIGQVKDPHFSTEQTFVSFLSALVLLLAGGLLQHQKTREARYLRRPEQRPIALCPCLLTSHLH